MDSAKQNDRYILLVDTDSPGDFSLDDPGGVVVIMPCIDTEQGKKTAEILLRRAGMNCHVVIANDTARLGFIKTLNDTASRINARYIVYLAQDAYPGRNWLRCAYDALENSGKGLLAFNDGKWRGRIASFGMVRTSWARNLYHGNLFYPGYQSHAADNELTVIARCQDMHEYNSNCVLMEYDPKKDEGGSNPKDRALFQKRFLQCFGGSVPQEKLQEMAREYRVRAFSGVAGEPVSVIVPAAYAESRLERFFGAFASLNTPFSGELIVIGQEDSSGAPETLTRYATEGFIRRIRNSQSFSVSVFCAYMAAMAKNPYLLFLQNDIPFTADVLDRVLKKMEKMPGDRPAHIPVEDDPAGLDSLGEKGIAGARKLYLCHRRILSGIVETENGAPGDRAFVSFVRGFVKQLQESGNRRPHDLNGTESRDGLPAVDTPVTKSLAARELLLCFQKRIFPGLKNICELENHAYLKWRKKRILWQPRVMIGTLYSGENELSACRQSIEKQQYPHISHEIFEGLPKKEAMSTLYETFLGSSCDILIKLDADMVVMDPAFVARVVDVFRYSDDLILLQMAILDYYTGRPMQGINAYSKKLDWSRNRQDPLFTDKAFVPAKNRLVVWTAFVDAVIHCPLASDFQGFHFGVHRGLKTRNALEAGRYDRAKEQFIYLERTWHHYKIRKDKNLLMAGLGNELALRDTYATDQLDYTNPKMHGDFEKWNQLPKEEVASVVCKMREEPLQPESLQELRDNRQALAASRSVASILFLIPHTGIYGGVNRFFELAQAMQKTGISSTIGVPDDKAFPGGKSSFPRPDYPDVEIAPLSVVLEKNWDVVVCGDYSSGIATLTALFDAGLTVYYLLNGWQYRTYNIHQIRATHPDVVVANSSYAAMHYADFAPHVMPGGVNIHKFYPEPPEKKEGRNFIVCVPSGRGKPGKRFEDALEAHRILREKGYNIDLHIITGGSKPMKNEQVAREYLNITASEVKSALCRADIVLCPEEDAGWNNPAAEALACRRPLICTPAGTTDFAFHEETAMVVAPRNPGAIARSIEFLLQNPDKAQAMAAAGHEKIRGFSWESVARSLGSIIECAGIDYAARKEKNKKAIDQISGEYGIAIEEKRC